MISQNNPVKLFVSHLWEVDEDYLRVFEFLESSNNFFYQNFSAPDRRPGGGREADRDELRKQITPVEVVILLASQHRRDGDLIQFMAHFAKAADKPLILISNFGATAPLAKSLSALADETVDWDQRALIDAIRRQARHEETQRWDSIDFKMD